MHIQKRHGLFPRILGKGDNARTLANLLLRGRKELDADDNATPYTNMPSNTVDSLIIIDRDVDFATTLLTQLTYEGLIDELIGIDHNQAEVSTSVTGISTQQLRAPPTSSSSTSPAPTSRQPLKRKIVLDSTDPLYAELRATNFATVGPKLNKIARRLESDYSTKDQARGIAELRDFVNKLPAYQQEHQSLALHTNLADDISKETRTDTFNSILEVQQNIAAGTDATYQHPTIEDLIARDVPLSTILRLLCLESTIVGGLRPRDLDHFKRLILHAYGYQHLLTLDRLEKMALLVPRSSASALLSPVGGITTGAQTSNLKTNYSYLRKELRLIVEDYNESAPEGKLSSLIKLSSVMHRMNLVQRLCRAFSPTPPEPFNLSYSLRTYVPLHVPFQEPPNKMLNHRYRLHLLRLRSAVGTDRPMYLAEATSTIAAAQISPPHHTLQHRLDGLRGHSQGCPGADVHLCAESRRREEWPCQGLAGPESDHRPRFGDGRGRCSR